MLPQPMPSNEYIHRPVLLDHSSSSPFYEADKQPAGRSRSFYDHHQQTEYERSKSHRTYGDAPHASYSTLPAKTDYANHYRARSPSPLKTNTWSSRPYGGGGGTDYYNSSNYRYNLNNSTTSFNNRASSRTDFPDFAPLSSPLEIKSLTENAIKSRQHISTYH